MKLAFTVFMLTPALLFGQLSRNSSVILHVDKNICYSGDTIRFSGYALKDKETNLYVELRLDSQLIIRKEFPLINNTADGSLSVPMHPGQYWIRAYTLNSKFFVMPLTIISDTNILRTRKCDISLAQKRTPNVQLQQEGDSILISTGESSSDLSISVTDSTLPSPSFCFQSSNSDFSNPDVDFLSYTGSLKIEKKHHKLLDYKDLIIVFEKDSQRKLLVCPVDSSGFLKIRGLNFTDTGLINYQINSPEKNVPAANLAISPPQYPPFTIPFSEENQPVPILLKKTDKKAYNHFDSAGYLKAVIVKSKWSDRNKALNTRYATGAFRENYSRFNFDVRDTNTTKWTTNLDDYFRWNCPSIRNWRAYDLYLNEKPVFPEILEGLNPQTDIAYIKIIDDPTGIMSLNNGPEGPPPVLAVYTRKGVDLRSLPGNLQKVPIIGYDVPAPFKGSDRITQYWAYHRKERQIKIKKMTGRLTIMGIDKNGKEIMYETILR